LDFLSVRDGATGERLEATTRDFAYSHKVGLKTFRDLFEEFRFHPESGSIDSDGGPCGPDSRGQLGRAKILVSSRIVIGKEANRISDAPKLNSSHELCQEFDSSLSEFELETLRGIRLRTLVEKTGLSKKWLIQVRKGRVRASKDTVAVLRGAAALL